MPSKKQIFSFLLSILILWTLNCPVNADDDTGEVYIVRDLNREYPYLETQLSLWQTTGAITTPVYTTDCGQPYLGGPNILGQSGGFEVNYINLPDHTSIYITLHIVFIDTWSNGDSFTITVGDTTSTIIYDTTTMSSGSSSLCTGSSTNMDGTLIIEAQHDDEILNIGFFKHTSSTASQFAIKNIALLFSTKDISTALSYCYLAITSGSLGVYDCGCSQGQYKDSSGNCGSCSGNCLTCNGPLASDCTSCDTGYGFDGGQCFQCDSSCLTCTGPGSDECATCPDGQYLYSDQTCQSTCTYKTLDDDGDLNCLMCTEENTNGDIDSDTLYYYPDDQTCKTICPRPYVVVAGQLCKLPLSQETIKQIQALSSAASTGADVMTGGLIAVTAVDTGSPHIAIVGKLARMFEYTRYIDVYHSPNLEVFYKSHRTTPGTVVIAPSMSSQTRAKFPYDPVPTIFEEYNVHSNFIVNFWDPLMTLLILSAACLLIYGIEIYAMKRIAKFAQYFRMATLALFSFLLGQFYSVYSDIILFSILNFRTLKANGTLTWIGFVIALGFFIFAYVALILHGKLLRRYQAYKAKARNDEAKNRFDNFQKDNEGVSMLYKAYKDITLLTQSYFWLLTLRNILFSLIIALLFAHPLAQIILIVILNGLTMVYLITKRPFIDEFGGLQQLAYEITLFIVNICFLIMACLDVSHSSTKKIRYTLGQIIIVCIFITKFLPAISIVPKVIITAKKFIKDYKEKKNKKTPAKDTTSNKEIETVMVAIPPEGTPIYSEPDEDKKLITHRLIPEADEPCESPEINKGEKLYSFPEINSEKELRKSPESNKDSELCSSPEMKTEKELCESPEINKDEEMHSTSEIKTEQKFCESPEINKDEELYSIPQMNNDKELCESPTINQGEGLCSNPEMQTDKESGESLIFVIRF